MRPELRTLTQSTYDLIIVGGGISGAAIAWDATLRGLRVALLEQGDFGQGASAYSFRMVHGGIRYLQHMDLPRLRESVRERRTLLRIAPHLVEPLPIAIPTFGHGMSGRGALLAGMRLYDAFAVDRNRGIRDPRRHIPPGRILSRAELLAMFPVLTEAPVTGAGVFWDAQVYSGPRLVMGFVQSAADRGACAASYTKATGLLLEGSRVIGVLARDELGGDTLRVRGRVVVNAAGGWASRVLESGSPASLPSGTTFSRDACFITTRPARSDHALALLGGTRDPDVFVSRAARHLFIVPWHGVQMVGVWHQVFTGDPDDARVRMSEVEQWIGEINASCPALQLSPSEVACYNAGLTLFGENTPGASDLRYGHRSLIIDHQHANGISGLITAIGVRLTVARRLAERVLPIVGRKLGLSLPRCTTENVPIAGGELDGIESLKAELAGQELPVAEIARDGLARSYGSQIQQVLGLVRETPELGELLDDSPVIGAQVVYAVRHEMARRLADVVYRRTDLGTSRAPSDLALEKAAMLMGRELGWTGARVADELAHCRSRFPWPVP